MIIGFAGRMRSGKTELAKVCEELGYRKLYFALPLKQLCADLLDISVEGLNEAKNNNTDISLFLGDDICTILSEETEIPLEDVRNTCYGKTIVNVREMLQFIGTDLIRRYNTDWHVNRVRQMIEEGYDYVIDDVRFPNEKKMIEDLGGYCWFVTRTTLDNVSNHESETSITWHNCWNKLIINDTTLQFLHFKWNAFMGDYVRSCSLRDKEFDRILENGLTAEITPMSVGDFLMLSSCMFSYVPKGIDKEDVKNMKMTENNALQITYNDDSIELVYNQLIIEDLKTLL
jgi:hypothetical protein